MAAEPDTACGKLIAGALSERGGSGQLGECQSFVQWIAALGATAGAAQRGSEIDERASVLKARRRAGELLHRLAQQRDRDLIVVRDCCTGELGLADRSRRAPRARDLGDASAAAARADARSPRARWT